jgi:hypothetical protein
LTDNSNTDNTLVDINDLSAFENELFERKPAEEQVEVADEVDGDEEVTETELETDEDVDASAETEDDDLEEDETPKEEPKAKKGRKSFKERIDELTAEKYEARREVDNLRRELEKLKVRPHEEVVEEQTKAPQPKLASNAPKPDAVNEKGEPLYELGEFDPQYITDLTKFMVAEQLKAVEESRKAQEQQKEVETAHAALQQHWQENLEAAETELPDIREKIANMVEVFQDVEPTYGEYLAGTIMSCDHGPEIMYYLSQNIGEAQNIVASGPAAATLAIGRLEAQFTKPAREVPKSNKRVSVAPEPPQARSRGTHGKFSVRPDTDNLEAFERDFFKK